MRSLNLTFDIYGMPGAYTGSASMASGNLSCCPFCCSHDVEPTNTWTPLYSVKCNDCGAEGPQPHTTDRTSFATIPAAKRAHRRAIEAAVQAWEERL